MYNQMLSFFNIKQKNDLSAEELRLLDAENKKAWTNIMRGVFGLLTLQAVEKLDVWRMTVYFVAFCAAKPAVEFSYDNRETIKAWGMWAMTDGAKFLQNKVMEQLPNANSRVASKR